MPAVPASFFEPLWVHFEALTPPVVDTHPLGCHHGRARRDEWITAGIFEQIELEADDQVVGLQLGDVSMDGRHAKAPGSVPARPR